jgi:colanic acid biosynthesis glycosyl transferase WcaI
MDLQPDAAADLGMPRDGFLVRVLYALERMAYRNAALVTTLNDGMRQKIVGKGVPEDKVKLFPMLCRLRVV